MAPYSDGRFLDLTCSVGGVELRPEKVVPDHPTWIFTPDTTLANGKHGLMVVLHGCDQSYHIPPAYSLADLHRLRAQGFVPLRGTKGLSEEVAEGAVLKNRRNSPALSQ
jgi:hypothetical protein